MKKTIAFIASLLLLAAPAQITAFAEDAYSPDADNVSEEVRTTDAYIPDGISVETDTNIPNVIAAPTDIINEELEAICEALRNNILDADTIYVAKREKLVIFGSEKQQDIDAAKAYCSDNGINLDLVFFILIHEENTELITDHETIIAMLNDFIKENQLANVIVGDDEPSGKVILSYYYVHPEQEDMFKNFISEKSIDADEITILVMEGTGETPDKSDDSILPQTGYSNIHKAITGLAALMTVTGTALIAKSKKKDK